MREASRGWSAFYPSSVVRRPCPVSAGFNASHSGIDGTGAGPPNRVVTRRSTAQVCFLARTRDSPMVAPVASRAGEVTRLLHAARAGDASAIDRIVPLVYEDLRRVARRQLGRGFGN